MATNFFWDKMSPPRKNWLFEVDDYIMEQIIKKTISTNLYEDATQKGQNIIHNLDDAKIEHTPAQIVAILCKWISAINTVEELIDTIPVRLYNFRFACEGIILVYAANNTKTRLKIIRYITDKPNLW